MGIRLFSGQLTDGQLGGGGELFMYPCLQTLETIDFERK